MRANVRTAEAAKRGLTPALNVAFRAGSVTGLLVVGLGLFGVAGYYGVLTSWFDIAQDDAIDDLIGLAFGGSLISVFARLGGIYTKLPPTSAPTSSGRSRPASPRTIRATPAVIADNVGDTGDCAGMAADLFETGGHRGRGHARHGLLAGGLPLYPLALGGISIVASVIGIWSSPRRTWWVDCERALQGGRRGHGAVRDRLHPGDDGVRRGRVQLRRGHSAAVIGLVITFALVAITEYYTGTRWGPVKSISRLPDRPCDEHHRSACWSGCRQPRCRSS